MKLRIILLSAGIAILLLPGCRKQTNTDTAQTQALLQADQAFSAASVNDGFADAFTHYALIDATLLPQDGTALQGKTQIAQSLAGIPAGTKISWTAQAADASGKLGYTWGIYTSSGTDKRGQPTVAYGKYLSVWQRQGNEWKLKAMMTNQSPGPQG